MPIAKRVLLFLATNILIVFTISIVLNLLGVKPYLTAYGLDYQSLMIFCLVWGMGGAFLSLALSRFMAKMMMRVQVIDPNTADSKERWLYGTVERLAKQAGLPVTPEVGVYPSGEINAFATGPSRSRSLVAVSAGLLNQMDKNAIEGVLGHEIAHVLERHSLRSAVGQLSVAAAWSLFLDPGAGLAGLATLASAAQLKFSRDHEREADEVGLELLAAADIDPAGMSAFFTRLAAEEGQLGTAIALLSTHPASAERAEELAARRRALGERVYRTIDGDWDTLRKLAEGP